MTKADFIDMVSLEITEGEELDISPNEKMMDNIILQAVRYFRQNWDEAKQTEYVVIQKALLETDLYKTRRIIKLPKCVRAIYSLEEVGADWINVNTNPDYKKVNFSYLNAAFTGDSDAMVWAIGAALYFDFVRTNLIVKTVNFSYSDKTNYLNIMGRESLNGLIAQAGVDIPEEKLYEADLFSQYVIGQCRMSIGRLFSVTQLKLLGRSGFDVSEIKEQGKDAVKEVKDTIKDENQNDISFMMIDGKYIGS